MCLIITPLLAFLVGMLVMEVRAKLLLIYIIINVIAFLYYLFGGENTQFIKHTENVSPFVHYVNITLTIMALIVICKSFNVIDSLKVKQTATTLSTGAGHKIISTIVILLQLFYLFGFIVFGGSVAGGEDTLKGGLFGLFVGLLQISNVSLVHIASSHSRGILWGVVLSLYAVTNLLQGWSAFILLLLVLYLFHREEVRKSINWLAILLYSTFGIVFLYPAVYLIRTSVRIMGQQHVKFEDVDLISALGEGSVIDYCLYTYVKLLERFEQYYLSLGSLINYDHIVLAYQSRIIMPFYTEGPQKVLFAREGLVSLGSYLPSIFYDDSVMGDYHWNVSPGILAYIYTESMSALFLYPYILLLTFVATVLLKSIGVNKLVFHLFFYLMIILVFTGWMSQFVFFIYSIFVYYVINKLVGFTILGIKLGRV